METKEKMIFYCERCNKELKFPEEINYFGRRVLFPEELQQKKVWCRRHFEDLQNYLKEKRQEERIPQLRIEAQQLLQECGKNKKQFIEIIKQIKRFITSFKKPIEIQNFSKQEELK